MAVHDVADQDVTTLRPGSKVRAVDRTLELLKLFATSEEPDWRLDALAHGTSLPKSTVHRLLETLLSQGFVEPGASRGTYRLGASSCLIGQSAIRSRRPSPAVTDLLTRVSTRIGAGIGLSVRVGNEALILDRGSTGRAPTWRVAVGATLPCHSSAVGLALLSHLPDNEIVRMYGAGNALPQWTSRSPATVEDLVEEVRRVRSDGVAIDDGHFEVGVRCIGVPVPDDSGRLHFALGLTLSAANIGPENQQLLVAPLRQLAAVLGKHAHRLSLYDTHRLVVGA